MGLFRLGLIALGARWKRHRLSGKSAPDGGRNENYGPPAGSQDGWPSERGPREGGTTRPVKRGFLYLLRIDPLRHPHLPFPFPI